MEFLFQQKYNNIIPLGFFCSVASELRRIGLRDKAYPFDWLITNFEDVLTCINNNFVDFLDLSNLEKCKNDKTFYVKNNKFNQIYFLHDFKEGEPIESQIKAVKEKYDRRISRLYSDMLEGALFIRYVQNKYEWEYIRKNKRKIQVLLKQYNKKNKIIYILNDDIKTSLHFSMKAYKVKKDEKDSVAREFLKKNPTLEKFIIKTKRKVNA